MKELRKRFNAKEPPSAMRHQLLDARQELGESLVEFVERIQRLVQRPLPGISSQALTPFAVDCFLRGCQEKVAAVLAMERQPQTVPKALQVLKHILERHQAIYGLKSVSFRQLKQVADREPHLRTPARPVAELALKVEGMLTSHEDPSRLLERSSRLGTGSLGTHFQSGVTGDFVRGCPFDGSLSASGGLSPSWKTVPAEAESHKAPPVPPPPPRPLVQGCVALTVLAGRIR